MSGWRASASRSARATRALLLQCALVLVAAIPWPPRASADAAGESRQRYERALSLYQEGVYDAALVELRRAYELRPSYKLLYNIAQVHLALHDYAAASSVFEDYLSQGGAQIPAERREAVSQEIERLALRVGELSIRTDVEGADVFVDDMPMGKTPLARALRVNSGLRRVVLRHPEHPEQRARVSVAGGERREVALNFAPAPSVAALASPPSSRSAEAPERTAKPEKTEAARAARPAAAPTSAAPEARKARRKIVIGWSFAGALAAGAAGVGALTLLRSNDLQDKRQRKVVGPNELEQDAARVKKLALIADGLAVGAAAVGALSIWFTVGARRDRRARNETASARGIAPVMGLHMSPTGLNLHARY